MSPPLARAKAYPFPIPEHSYVLGSRDRRDLVPGDPLPDLSGLTPVLASGSNQSPDQLRRKFDRLDDSPIPVLKCTIEDFDAVHSPHFTAYGSIPATIHHHPGVAADLAINWLNEAQLERMHETEVPSENYFFARLDNVSIDVWGGQKLSSVHVYLSQRGVLSDGGGPLALQAVSARGREWPAVSQQQVQALARDRLSPDRPLDAFIQENIIEPETRRERIDGLARDALPFTWPHTRIIDL